MAEKIKTIDEYIAGFDPVIQKTLIEIRAFIKSEAPEATEKISYGMPAFFLNGNLVYFAAFKDHYSLFPGSSVINKFKNELSPYCSGKGTLRFPLNKPLPWTLLKKVIHCKAEENKRKADAKKKK